MYMVEKFSSLSPCFLLWCPGWTSSSTKTSSRGSFFSARRPICRRRVHIMRRPSAAQLLCVVPREGKPNKRLANSLAIPRGKWNFYERACDMQRAREKLMQPANEQSKEAAGRCAQAAKVHSLRTLIRRARLNKLISTAGREGWQKEMGKLLWLAGSKKCAGRFLAGRQSSSLKWGPNALFARVLMGPCSGRRNESASTQCHSAAAFSVALSRSLPLGRRGKRQPAESQFGSWGFSFQTELVAETLCHKNKSESASEKSFNSYFSKSVHG